MRQLIYGLFTHYTATLELISINGSKNCRDMNDVPQYLPNQINSSPWLTAHTLNELQGRADRDRIVLPICSLGTPVSQLEAIAPLALPNLYHEALNDDSKSQLLPQIEKR